MTTEVTVDGVKEIVKRRQGIRLDIGGGGNPQQGFVNMDIRQLPAVDIVHDFNVHPWPLEDESVLVAIASHVLEHIPGCAIDNGRTRWPWIEFMDDLWRVMKVGGQFTAAMPHGNSQGFLQDPTHVSAINQVRFYYFDPALHQADGTRITLYDIYQPKPWRLQYITWSPSANIEVIMAKREIGDLTPSTVKYE